MSKKNNRFTCSQKLRVWALSDVFFDQHGVPEWSGWPRRDREFVEIWWGKAFERDFCLVRKALKILVVSNSQEYIEMLTHKIIRSQPKIYSNMSFLPWPQVQKPFLVLFSRRCFDVGPWTWFFWRSVVVVWGLGGLAMKKGPFVGDLTSLFASFLVGEFISLLLVTCRDYEKKC